MATQTPQMPGGSSAAETPFPRSASGEDIRSGTSAAPTVERMVQGAHDALDRVAQRAQPAIDTIASKASDVTAMRDEWMTHCRSEVRAHPLGAVMLSLLAGVLVGRLMSR